MKKRQRRKRIHEAIKLALKQFKLTFKLLADNKK